MHHINDPNLGKKWVEINDDWRGTYYTNSQIKFKTSMLKSNLCDFNDEYIFMDLSFYILKFVAIL